MITIKQLADDLGVTKEAVRKRVNQLVPSCIKVGTNRQILINQKGERIIRESMRIGTDEVGIGEVGTNQDCTDEVGTGEVGTNQDCTDEVGTEEVGTNQVGTRVYKQKYEHYEELMAMLRLQNKNMTEQMKILNEQLRVKDEQITTLQGTLQQAQQNINQVQQLNALDKRQEIENKPKGLRRLFSRKKNQL